MTRTAVALLALALVVAACGDEAGEGSMGSTGPTTTSSVAATTSPSTVPPPTTTSDPRPLPGGALEVLVVGDSVTFDAEAAITAALQATGAATVRNGAVFGLGFSEDAGISFDGAAEDLLAGEPVEQVVAMVGSWDHLTVQRDPDGYAAQVRAALDVLTAGGRAVLLLGEPPSAPEKGEEPIRTAMNEVLEAEAAEVPGVTYLATDTVIGDARGDYVMAGPDGLLRKPDGRHLCPAGATRFGAAVLAALSRQWQLPPADPAWALGPWRQDVRYDDPPGGCPDG